ncbi:MAG: phage protein Gp36 family protein [Cycloclasticus sp.]
MSYCTLQDLRDRYGDDELIQLTDRTNIGTINESVVNRAVADADGEIDGYLGGRFNVPADPITKSLVRVACDISRYYLYDDGATEAVVRRYNDAVKFVKSIGKGEISIGVDAAGEAQESESLAIMQSGGSVFNRKDKSFI